MMPITLDVDKPRKLPDPSPGLTFQEAPLFLARLVNPAFLISQIFPLLEEAERAGDWYVAHRHDGPGGSFSLQVFVWPPGSRTKIHDHSSWGAFCCVVGSLVEERYERLDDGSQPDHAHLRKAWRRVWREEDGVSTVLPYEGGIHRVGNPSTSTAISVHLYGPKIGQVDGRDYAPSQNYVCDRMDV
jgi:predicted metal-dependent enzyme (double-stranded beta helix superfamily)